MLPVVVERFTRSSHPPGCQRVFIVIITMTGRHSPACLHRAVNKAASVLGAGKFCYSSTIRVTIQGCACSQMAHTAKLYGNRQVKFPVQAGPSLNTSYIKNTNNDHPISTRVTQPDSIEKRSVG